MAEGESGYKPTLYSRVADRANKVGDWIINTFGVIEMKPRNTTPLQTEHPSSSASTTVDKWGRPAGEFIRPPKSKPPTVYDGWVDETPPPGVTKLIPKDKR